MSDSEWGWKSLLETESPSGSTLKRALFTTYDQPDERFLVEHLLPCLFKLDHEPDSEGEERQYFLLELGRKLKQLHNRITIISSTLREEPSENMHLNKESYGWIWRSIRSLTVGCNGKAVQHAKLWLLHWGSEEGEYAEHLEIVVSSANLTGPAFRGQIQAVWRVCLELYPQNSNKRLAGWGILPDFISELAKSSNDSGQLKIFIDLLKRVECPDSTTFIASAPGTYTREELRRRPWGTAGLKKIKPSGRGTVRTTILSPYIGHWSPETLKNWCRSFEGTPDRIELAWIKKDHPWATNNRWILPERALTALKNINASLLQLRSNSESPKENTAFNAGHYHTDKRWSHAKVYSLSRGNSRRLLITSANFSGAAWGKEGKNGHLTIDNFELGVCINQAEWPLEDLNPIDDWDQVAVSAEMPSYSTSIITWGQARWDGETIHIEFRCAKDHEVIGKVICRGNKENAVQITCWKVGKYSNKCAQIKWVDAKNLPSIRLEYKDEYLELSVFDDRPLSEIDTLLPPGIDDDKAQRIHDELLFELYGGHFASSENKDISHRIDKDRDSEQETGRESYAVLAFESARYYFQIVDNWAAKLEGAIDEFDKQILIRDGELLVTALAREELRTEKKGIDSREVGLKLAGEELALRIKKYQKE